mgnify:CR=1 FL=1
MLPAIFFGLLQLKLKYNNLLKYILYNICRIYDLDLISYTCILKLGALDIAPSPFLNIGIRVRIWLL